MDLSKLDINSIAQDIDMGMHCHIHKETLEVITFPDPNELYDPEFWEKDIQKVEDNYEDYVSIRKMDSTLSFSVMEDFTKTVKNKALRSRMQSALDNRKPFRNWNNIIHDTGDERQDWFDFKQARMETWVACHLDPQDKYGPETLYSIKTEEPEPIIFALHTTIYMVDDLEKAADWYSAAFSIKPSKISEDYVAFNVGGFELGLQLNTSKEKHPSRAISYWAVEDIEEALYQLHIVDAKVHQEITKLKKGIKQASVIDPWGNIIGLVRNPNFEIDI